jgi:hypothetical protein
LQTKCFCPNPISALQVLQRRQFDGLIADPSRAHAAQSH